MQTFNTFSEAYPSIIRDVLNNGKKAKPRGQEIVEICGYSFKILTLADSLPLQKGRKLNYRFGIIEGLCNVFGEYPEETVAKFNSKILDFPTPAYAPRISETIVEIYSLLQKDPDSRQAFISIFKNDDTLNISTPVGQTPPCTIGLQFLIRDKKLNMIATMRSNDALWGLAYDVNQFMMVQRALASLLGIKTGWYIHQAGSMHVYTQRMELINATLETSNDLYEIYHYPNIQDWPMLTFQEIDENIGSLLSRLNGKEEDIPLIYPFKEYYEFLTRKSN